MSNTETKYDGLYADMIEAGKKTGQGLSAALAAIKQWRVTLASERKLEEASTGFRVGYLMGRLGITQAKAETVLALKPYSKDTSDTDDRRTIDQQKAVDTVKVIWSNARKAAGLVNARNGRDRNASKTNARSTAKDDNGEKNTPKGVFVKQAKTYEDVREFALLIVGAIDTYERMNAKVPMGDVGTAFRQFCESVRKAPKTLKGDKGTVSTVPNVQTKLAAELKVA